MYKVGKLIDEKKGIFKLDNDEIVQTNGGEFYELNDDGTIKRGSELIIKYLGEVPMSPEERAEKEAKEELKQLQDETCRGGFCNNLTKNVKGWLGLKFKSKKSKTKTKKSKTKSKKSKTKTKSMKSKTKTKSMKSKTKTKSKKSKTKSK
jgi:hypothetical protein